jgi:phi13 family phage major tail protein
MSTTIVGVEKLYYAILSDETATPVLYDAPKQLGFVQEMKVAPQSESASQYGDNRIIETATAMGNIELELTLTGISPEVEAEVLGHQYGNGAIIKKDTDVAPYIALLYKRVKANGKSRFKVLYKGKMGLPEEANKSKEDKVEFQSTEMKATFAPRIDGVYEFQLDEEVVTGTAGQALVSDWFNEVQEPVLPSAT